MMNQDHTQRAHDILHRVVDLESGERRRVIELEYGDDDAISIHAEVERLVARGTDEPSKSAAPFPASGHGARSFARRNRLLIGGVATAATVSIFGGLLATKIAMSTRDAARRLEHKNYVSNLAAAAAAIERGDDTSAAALLADTPQHLHGFEHAVLSARLDRSLATWNLVAPVFGRPVAGIDGDSVHLIHRPSESSILIQTYRLDDGEHARGWFVTGVKATVLPVYSAMSDRVAVVTLDDRLVVIDGTFVLSGDTVDARMIDELSSGNDVAPVSWDPTGTQLIYCADGTWIAGETLSSRIHSERCVVAAVNHAGTHAALGFPSSASLVAFASSTAPPSSTVTLQDSPRTIGFSPDDTQIAIGGADRSIVTLDAASLEVSHQFDGHQNAIHSIAWTSGGTHIVTASRDQSIRVWDVESGRRIYTLDTGAAPEAMACVLDDRGLVVAIDDSVARTYRLADPWVMHGHSSPVHHVAISPDSRLIASTECFEPWIHVWDARTMKLRTRLRAPESDSRQLQDADTAAIVAFSSDGSRIIAWSLTERVSYNPLTGQPHPVSDNGADAETSDDQTTRPTSGDVSAAITEGSVVIYRDGGVVGKLMVDPHTVNCVAFSPDGTRIATGSIDMSVRLFDASTLAQLLVLRGHTQPVRSIAFSPDGTMLISGAADGTLRVWDTLTPRERRTSSEPLESEVE